MTDPILLDTCAAIWIAEDQELSDKAVAALDKTFDRDEIVYISPITAWEVGLLMAKGRIASPIGPKEWFSRLTSTSNTALAGMPPDILIESSYLPGEPPRDPADRIILATAREYGFAVMTRDRTILDYAQAGHLKVIAC